MQYADVTLDDKYELEKGRIFITGIQALVRLPLLQRRRDQNDGLRTAGFISGYQGSPLGAYDIQLRAARRWLDRADVRFEPGVNEDLAATAVWGTQQLHLIPGAKYDGVFSIWYGKGPGVDRSGDPFKHANRAGSSPHGGVLLLLGDDHAAKSSTMAHQSDQSMIASGIPLLYPATIQEFLDFGVHGWAMSRFSGCYVGFKCVNETVEASATIDVATGRVKTIVPGELGLPDGGLNIRRGWSPLEDEERLYRYKLPAAQEYIRANGLDRIVMQGARRNLGIVTCGKSYLDVRQALSNLKLNERAATERGIGVYKVGGIWPLEPEGLQAFARGYRKLMFVEEKQPILEEQTCRILFSLPAADRPEIIGKRDGQGRPLLPDYGQLDPGVIAMAIGEQLRELRIADGELDRHLDALGKQVAHTRQARSPLAQRLPYFCAGCPHNTSTRVPKGSMAMSGIGCHTMAIWMDRNTLTPTQMGGEGANWTGMAAFSDIKHMFQNLGDGTYYHSGLLAIRAAVRAGVNITYKVLLNDAVAMTGGQPVLGQFDAPQIAHQVVSEGVRQVAVVSDEPERYQRGSLPADVGIHHRDDLDRVQQQFRDIEGTTVIIYDQVCALEKRRRRKRGQLIDPSSRIFINEAVCEGCGECSVQSNCVSILPKETALGRKREIDQSSCNKDFSCVKGFCPSFVTVEGSELRNPGHLDFSDEVFEDIPEPTCPSFSGTFDVLITGIGGTGVVTIGAVLGMATHLQRQGVSVFDMTGLAQKNGAVFSHLRIASTPEDIATPKIGLSEARLLLACDPVAAVLPEALDTIHLERTIIVANTHCAPTANFQSDPDIDFHTEQVLDILQSSTIDGHFNGLAASRFAKVLLGNTIAANMMLVGYALQREFLPLSADAIERAIDLNGVAVEFNKRALRLGRLAAHDLERLTRMVPSLTEEIQKNRPQELADIIETRCAHLVQYQNEAYAIRYRRFVARVEEVERQRTPKLSGLAASVSTSYFRVLAYKDEYEVARLYTDGNFERMLKSKLQGRFRLRLHLAPPLIAPRDRDTGIPRKMTFGSWILVLMRLLARLKFLRGTIFDPFAYSAERRMERQLIGNYENLVDEVVENLNPHNHEVAVQMAQLPEMVKGFGHVKQRNLEKMLIRRQELLDRFQDLGKSAMT